MVEVIKPPPGKDWSHEWTCGLCGARLRAFALDVKDSPDQRDPGSYVQCPVCTHMEWVHPPKGYRYANRG